MGDEVGAARRNVALVGPYTSGKTTLLESLLAACGAIARKGRVEDKNTVGDGSAEARGRQMSVEVSAADGEYKGTPLTFLDCPGSVEVALEAQNALLGADVAVIVAPPDPDHALSLATLLKFLNDHDIPHLVFVNKLDSASVRVASVIDGLKPYAGRPLLLRQVPIRKSEAVTGYIDLLSEQAFKYKEGGPADKLGAVPDEVKSREGEARTVLLETLADFDDTLLEALLEDKEPRLDSVLEDLRRTIAEDKVIPVFIGSALHGWGVRALLDTLVRETPDAAATAARRGIDLSSSEPLAQVIKTYNSPHGGKLSLARIWRGTIQDGAVLNGVRVAGVFQMMGVQPNKLASAEAGRIVALGRLEGVTTGDTLVAGKSNGGETLPRIEPPRPVYGQGVTTEKREDEVKMTTAIGKVAEEDPALLFEQNPETHQSVLWGQGEIHLQVAFDRLRNKYGLELKTVPTRVAYKEAIRRSISQHGRFKRQSGGHGQFGDVHLDIKPLPRGSGFQFISGVVGGAVPRQYIPAVEAGVRDYLQHGPLGFAVVDVSVTLTDGQYHSVDSSDQAFKQAARIAMSEGMAKCDPVLLEPIHEVVVTVPKDYTPKAQRLISGRRGQILGFAEKPGWEGWDEVTSHMPQSELGDLIIELRSLTQGTGTFAWRYDHLQELTGRLADKVLESARAKAS
ncbi:MAG TPA: elongation factor G [Alphaproteobacteria bacterium]|nr:elongation factor G [Alphaproteobacteria bacterium]